MSLTIVGDGDLRKDIEALTLKPALEDRVHLTGALPHRKVMEHLEKAHILMAPSITTPSNDQEGIPNVLKEAMATGLPVISTRHSGIPELVEDGVSGFLVPEKDAEALADRLIHLADHPEVWGEMGRAGRAKVEAEYDIDKLNDRLVGLYENLIATGPDKRVGS